MTGGVLRGRPVSPVLGTRLTAETVDLVAAMGSTLIGSVKARDSWVFAGRAGTESRSHFEKVSERKHNPPLPAHPPCVAAREF